jgi:hypothetical protein
MKYAFINDGVLQDVVMTHPSLLFASGYADQFVEVPDDCFSGWTFDGTTYAPPPPETAEQRSYFVRGKRDSLLAECDWVVTKFLERGEAVPKEWATYRQALRDLPKQAEFPWRFDWPESPA